MLTPDEEFELELLELKRSYKKRLVELLPLIDSWRRALHAQTLSHDNRDALMRKAHQIAGSGASYGFAELTDKSKALENILIDHSDVRSDIVLEAVDAFCEAVAAAAI